MMKHSQVHPDGTYVKAKKGSDKLKFGSLIMGRAMMVEDSANVLKVATTIAIRYAAVRRAFHDSSGERLQEQKILDFQTHKYRLMPLLATAYAFHFTKAYMKDLYEGLQKGLDEGDVSALPDVHATSSGLKSFCTWFTHWGIEQCRQSCGGHGYSAYNGLSDMSADFAVMCTWEGDNTVMAQQTSKYLMAQLQKVVQGEKLAGSIKYLEQLPQGA